MITCALPDCSTSPVERMAVLCPAHHLALLAALADVARLWPSLSDSIAEPARAGDGTRRSPGFESGSPTSTALVELSGRIERRFYEWTLSFACDFGTVNMPLGVPGQCRWFLDSEQWLRSWSRLALMHTSIVALARDLERAVGIPVAEERWATCRQVAEAQGVSIATVRTWYRRGRIRARYIDNGLVQVEVGSVARYLAERGTSGRRAG